MIRPIKNFASLVYAIVTVFPLASGAVDQLEAVDKNKAAIHSMEEKNFGEAENKLVSALGNEPFNPLLKLNLGITYELQAEKLESPDPILTKAVKEYESVLRMSGVDDETKFIAHFNAGNALAKMQDVDGAIKHYQGALDLKPDSTETKNNIEMLFMGGKGKGKGQGKSGKDPDPNQKGQGQGAPQDEQQEEPKFNSEKLSKEDVRKIMEELKSQEQKIRAMEYSNQKPKERPAEKDW